MKKLLFCGGFFLSMSLLLAQNVQIIKKKELLELLKPNENQVYVYNFWASWCAPCVKELPIFKQTAEKFGNQVKVVLISLDFAEELEKAKKILQKKEINFSSYLLDETKYNTWIDDVEPRWQGAIPMTIVQKGKKRIFINEELTWEQLEKHISSLLK
ncbi:MAG: TlpA disulfide reductase family protein [Raineya sp.]|nr:TlpA family protein disulfide reductase [Raineya sp.]MDW8295274.1 TlpA disulfide reductase family protein [Raineya sp.]